MEIVINIPKEDYQNLKGKDKFDDMYLGYYEKLIVHGTPLPGHHGRLIDADALTEKAPEIQEYLDVLAPTIIEGSVRNET